MIKKGKCPYEYIDYIGIEEIPMQVCSFKSNEEFDEFDEIYCFFKEKSDCPIFRLQQENQELKKQLESYKRLGFKHLNDKCNKLGNQQKEFIEYLENEININPYDISDYDYEDIINTILSKYKEIIGGKE